MALSSYPLLNLRLLIDIARPGAPQIAWLIEFPRILTMQA